MVQEGQTVLHANCAKGDVGMTKFILEQFNPNLEALNEVCRLMYTFILTLPNSISFLLMLHHISLPHSMDWFVKVCTFSFTVRADSTPLCICG